jgi:hypothetical protein
MLINPRIVFTFTRQRWNSTTFSLYLALLIWRSNVRNIPYLPTVLLSSRNISMIQTFVMFAIKFVNKDINAISWEVCNVWKLTL